jgi:DNA-binding GntR family transcriptional regulator
VDTAEARLTDQVLPTYSALKDRLREEIINGALSPGERLKVAEIAGRFGTSTMPVRQALQDLHAEGLVELLPNRGASVRRVNAALAESIYDVRKALMGLMIERCVLFVTNSDLNELERLEQDIHRSENVDHVFGASDVFYRRIFGIARNDVAMNVLNGMWPLMAALRRRYGLRSRKAVYHSHRALLDALRRRDTDEAVGIAQQACEESKRDLIARLAHAEGR